MTPFLILLLGCGLIGGADEDEHGDHGDEHGDHEEGGEHGGEGDVVELTPAAIAAARIRAEPATEGALESGLGLPARIALDPRKEAIVSAWISGQVDSISVRPGDHVTKGTRLGQVQSPELGTATANYRTAKARDQAADARHDRLKRLEADGVSSKAQVLEAEADHAEAAGLLAAAEERLRILGVPISDSKPHEGSRFPSRVPVRSPITGTVLTTDASVGQSVQPGEMLFRIGDLDEVWLMLDVYERDLASVREGQTVQFTVEAWPDETFTGTVAQVGDWIEPGARSVEVRVVVPNPEHRLKPNMFANAELTVDRAEVQSGVVLPADAVQMVEGREVVFIEEEPGHYLASPVVIADRTAERVRLSSGVEFGQRVIVSGAFALKSELAKSELGEGHAH